MGDSFEAAMRGFARAILDSVPPCEKCTLRKGCGMEEFLLVSYCNQCRDVIVERVMMFARLSEDEAARMD